MRTRLAQSAIVLLLCVVSGGIGAYSTMALQAHSPGEHTLRVQKLELTGAHGEVRAVFSVQDDGSVFLRMLSKKGAPAVELRVDEDPMPAGRYTPAATLILRDGAGTPVTQWRTTGEGKASLSFSSTNRHDIVGLGYSGSGGVIDGHERGMWGLQIAGPDHTATGLNVFTEDGALKGFQATLKPPARKTPSH